MKIFLSIIGLTLFCIGGYLAETGYPKTTAGPIVLLGFLILAMIGFYATKLKK